MKFTPIGFYDDGRNHPPVEPVQNYSNDRYEAVNMGHDASSHRVLVLKSREPTPMPWMVLYGFSTVFFRSFREAMDFCNSRGMTLMQEAEDSRYEQA